MTVFPDMTIETIFDFNEALARLEELKRKGKRPILSTNKHGNYAIKY